MLVFNMWGAIEPKAISSKLGFYISNFKGSCHEEWAEELVNEFTRGLKTVSLWNSKSLEEVSKEVAAKYGLAADSSGEWVNEVVDGMIFADFDYTYEGMPLGGWESNCFDGRLCELDYAEKLVDFFSVFSGSLHRGSFPSRVPAWIYSSNPVRPDYQRLLYWGGCSPSELEDSLCCWGRILDGFLRDRNDYLLLDYLVNTFYFDKAMDKYGILKRYSLCQLFLEKENERELDWKLIPFLIDIGIEEKDAKDLAGVLRRLRNKLAHGDFAAFDVELEKYARRFMDGRFWFDYAELSRRNWTIGNVCLVLDKVLYSMAELLFFDREKIDQMKEQRRVG